MVPLSCRRVALREESHREHTQGRPGLLRSLLAAFLITKEMTGMKAERGSNRMPVMSSVSEQGNNSMCGPDEELEARYLKPIKEIRPSSVIQESYGLSRPSCCLDTS